MDPDPKEEHQRRPLTAITGCALAGRACRTAHAGRILSGHSRWDGMFRKHPARAASPTPRRTAARPSTSAAVRSEFGPSCSSLPPGRGMPSRMAQGVWRRLSSGRQAPRCSRGHSPDVRHGSIRGRDNRTPLACTRHESVQESSTVTMYSGPGRVLRSWSCVASRAQPYPAAGLATTEIR